MQTVEQGIAQVAANVLVIEHPHQTLNQVRNMLSRFVKARREVSEESKGNGFHFSEERLRRDAVGRRRLRAKGAIFQRRRAGGFWVEGPRLRWAKKFLTGPTAGQECF